MVNKVFLIGRLGKDPVLKHFANDNCIAEFSLATDDSYKNKEGQKVEQVDWHNCKIPNGKLAKIAEQYLKKGALVHVEGKIKNRSYETSEGEKRYITEIVVDSFRMLDKNTATENTTANNNQSTPQADDDLPF